MARVFLGQLAILLHFLQLETEVDVVRTTKYGTRYEIRMTLQTPLGVPLTVRTIWQIDDGKDVPRLITLYPD